MLGIDMRLAVSLSFMATSDSYLLREKHQGYKLQHSRKPRYHEFCIKKYNISKESRKYHFIGAHSQGEWCDGDEPQYGDFLTRIEAV